MMTKTRLETRGSGRHSYVVNVLNKNYANTWTWLLDHCNALASSWIKWFKVFNIYWISNFHLLTKMKPSAIKARVQCLKNSRVVIWNWSGQTLARRSKLWLWKANLSLYLQLSRFVNPPFKINVGRRISISHCLFHSFLIAPTMWVPHLWWPGQVARRIVISQVPGERQPSIAQVHLFLGGQSQSTIEKVFCHLTILEKQIRIDWVCFTKIKDFFTLKGPFAKQSSSHRIPYFIAHFGRMGKNSPKLK